MGISTGDNDKETQEYTDKLVSSSLRERLNDGFQSMGDSIASLWKSALDDVDNQFYPLSDFWTNASGGVGDILSGLGLPGGFGHPAHIRRLMEDQSVEEGITGLYGYRTPSEKQFVECQDLKGLSVWDTRGWWRCLFPEAVARQRVNPEHLRDVLTREKVENDAHHHLGLFFTDYTSYLTWRSNTTRLAEQRREKLAAAATSTLVDTPTTRAPEDFMDSIPGKNVLGTSQYVTYNTTPEGQETIKEFKTFYDDGSVKLRSEKQLQGSDGKPHVESFEKTISKDDAHKDGWFWRK